MFRLMNCSILARAGYATVVLSIVLFVSACGGGSESPKLAGNSVAPPVSREGDYYAAFSRARRLAALSPEEIASARSAFLKRERLAEAVVATRSVDMSAVDAEAHEFRNELIVRKYFEDFLREKANDAALAAHFRANARDFSPYRAHLAEITVNRNPDEANSGYDRVIQVQEELARGMSFASAAKKYSDDKRSARSGGELGWVASEMIPTQLDATVRALIVGEISTPVATKEGFVLLKLQSELQFQVVEFESVRERVRARVRHEERVKEADRLLSSVGYVEPT